MSTYADQMREVERRRRLAQALVSGGSAPQGQQAGRFYVGPSNTSAIAGLAGILGGRYMNKRADREEKDARTTEQARLADAFRRLQGGGDPGVDGAATPPDPRTQAASDIVGGLPIESQQQVLAGESIKQLFPGPKQSPFAKPSAKDFTPESAAKFKQTGNEADLVPRAEMKVSGGEVYDPSAVKPGQMLGRPPAGTTVNVNTGKSLYETMGDAQGKANVELYGQAQKAPDLLQRARRVKSMLGPGSQAITGAGADWLLSGAKVAAQLGFNTGDAAADTEALARDLAASTLDGIKASGLGAGSGFSNADRDFLEKVVGGTIRLEATTLARLADLNEKSALGTIQHWNATAGRLDPQQLKTLGMSPIEMPAGTPQPGASPKLQQNPDGSYTYTP